MKNESNVQMSLVINEGKTMLINFDERVVEREDRERGAKYSVYEYESVRLPREDFDYGGIVSAIVRARYSADDVEAIMLNGTETEEHEAEYNELHAWRSHAKEVAKQVLSL